MEQGDGGRFSSLQLSSFSPQGHHHWGELSTFTSIYILSTIYVLPAAFELRLGTSHRIICRRLLGHDRNASLAVSRQRCVLRLARDLGSPSSPVFEPDSTCSLLLGRLLLCLRPCACRKVCTSLLLRRLDRQDTRRLWQEARRTRLTTLQPLLSVLQARTQDILAIQSHHMRTRTTLALHRLTTHHHWTTKYSRLSTSLKRMFTDIVSNSL